MLAIELFYLNFSLYNDNKLFFCDLHKCLALFKLCKKKNASEKNEWFFPQLSPFL